MKTSILEDASRISGLATSLTFDPQADAGERWVCSLGPDASGAGPTPTAAIESAFDDLSAEAPAPTPAVRWLFATIGIA